MIDLNVFFKENKYIDFLSPIIIKKADELFKGINNDVMKTKIAFEFVRDEIGHSFDIQANVITAKASDVLSYKTGICHAKANLLAAILRSQNIPTGMCFQHISLASDDSLGYCVHCFNAVFLENHWIKLDARGNKKGIEAKFSLGKPILAFPNRKEYDEYFWNGIYADPHADTMKLLEHANTLQDIIDNFPDYVTCPPDITE